MGQAMDLFEPVRARNRERARPLAARMRPRNLAEYVGQDHFLAPGKLLHRMLTADRINSLIFFGPPGCGKTALAHVIANQTQSRFLSMNAVSAGIKEVREVLAEARRFLEEDGRRTILFLDEIHRFNRSQQDVLLPDVEEGIIILIGATTQNPFFAINTPLLSRSQIFAFEPLTREQIARVIRAAIADRDRGLGDMPLTLTDDALAFLCEISDGDARRALTALEIGVKSLAAEKKALVYDLALAQESIQKKVLNFDPTGDTHYDLASAFIKSIRGSDPQAAMYWLARMLESGEDPRFIARRLVILSSEDIGNADPQAMLIANAAWDAVERVGLPECKLSLSQAVCYLATAPKSNSATVAIMKAQKDVREGRTLPVPAPLRDKHYQGAAQLGHGIGYLYSHDHDGAWVDQDYIPAEVEYYIPSDRGFETVIQQRMQEIALRRARSRDPHRGSSPNEETTLT
jgi:putative ATPase